MPEQARRPPPGLRPERWADRRRRPELTPRRRVRILRPQAQLLLARLPQPLMQRRQLRARRLNPELLSQVLLRK